MSSLPENPRPYVKQKKIKEDFKMSINNISSLIPGLFTSPITEVFLDAVKIADSTQENEKQCNDLLRIILDPLEKLESSLADGVKSDVDVSKINMDRYSLILKSNTEYMNNLAHPTILIKIWKFITNKQVLTSKVFSLYS